MRTLLGVIAYAEKACAKVRKIVDQHSRSAILAAAARCSESRPTSSARNGDMEYVTHHRCRREPMNRLVSPFFSSH